MNMELPYSFYDKDDNGNFVRVKHDLLEIHGFYNFEKLMYSLTYKLKGKKCYYCREDLKYHPTIDHLYPRNFGGISIINNLVPACTCCNSYKNNMNACEFIEWKRLSSKLERRRYYTKVVNKKRKIRAKRGFDLPRKWIKTVDINFIIVTSNVENQNGEKYKKTLEFVERTGKLPRPLVISCNRFLLDGFTAYNVAKELEMKNVPVVFLENVIVV